MRAATAPKGLARQLLADSTINALRRKTPELSAAAPLARWQRVAPLGVIALTSALVVAKPEAASDAIAVTLAAPFLLVVTLRALALLGIVAPRKRAVVRHRLASIHDSRSLPTYSVLVALYREAAAAPGLVRGLARFDYPRDKLEIVFLLEEDDAETRAALSAAIRLPYMRIVTVPAGFPKTKPRALTYGLQGVSGELIAVYDAEDIPERAQLRKAAAAFAAAGDDVACVQAKLGLYNAGESWLSRQFTIEYAALFEAILPLLERLRLPFPLSGTSNHFRRDRLVEAGAWDPFNLTEDADLGLRFARRGYRVEMIESTTWEEAPATWKVWLGQRTRWIKGWLQTYLVHMRHPARLWRELGGWGFFGVQLTFGAMALSALAHPWMYVALIAEVARGGAIEAGRSAIWMIAYVVLISGYVTGVALPAASAARRRGGWLILSAIWQPIYWLAISLAAYRAVLDLILRPYYWEKTPHRGAHVRPRRRKKKRS